LLENEIVLMDDSMFWYFFEQGYHDAMRLFFWSRHGRHDKLSASDVGKLALISKNIVGALAAEHQNMGYVRVNSLLCISG